MNDPWIYLPMKYCVRTRIDLKEMVAEQQIRNAYGMRTYMWFPVKMTAEMLDTAVEILKSKKGIKDEEKNH